MCVHICSFAWRIQGARGHPGAIVGVEVKYRKGDERTRGNVDHAANKKDYNIFGGFEVDTGLWKCPCTSRYGSDTETTYLVVEGTSLDKWHVNTRIVNKFLEQGSLRDIPLQSCSLPPGLSHHDHQLLFPDVVLHFLLHFGMCGWGGIIICREHLLFSCSVDQSRVSVSLANRLEHGMTSHSSFTSLIACSGTKQEIDWAVIRYTQGIRVIQCPEEVILKEQRRIA